MLFQIGMSTKLDENSDFSISTNRFDKKMNNIKNSVLKNKKNNTSV